MDSKKIGELIKKIRKEKGYTQSDLADIIGVSPKTISKWETGAGIPDISILKKLSEEFEITIDDLLEGTSSNNKQKKKNKKVYILIIAILIISTFLIINIINKSNKMKEIEECTVIRTYYIDNVSNSNDENYKYITLHEFQIEGTFTVKISKVQAEKIKEKENYEITFKTDKDYWNTDELFNNSEIISVEHTNNIGLEQIGKSTCNKN